MQAGTNHEDADRLIGTILSENYKIHSVIGNGNTSRVYKARRRIAEKDVAIKLLHSELAGSTIAIQRFQHEAKATSLFAHPGVVDVYDFDVTNDGRPYLVLELLTGKTLSQQLAESGRLSTRTTLSLFKQLCSALEHCHSQGVIHRGLNPSEVVLLSATSGNSEFVSKIIDFGIAKRLPRSGQEDQTSRLARVDEVLGSPLYMSPEQRLGKNVDVRSDIYSLGCLMYEALVGTPPFSGDNLDDITLQHLNDQPAPLSDASSELPIPPWLESVVFKALAKDPLNRYQSMSEMLNALSEKDSQPSLFGQIGKLFRG